MIQDSGNFISIYEQLIIIAPHFKHLIKTKTFARMSYFLRPGGSRRVGWETPPPTNILGLCPSALLDKIATFILLLHVPPIYTYIPTTSLLLKDYHRLNK